MKIRKIIFKDYEKIKKLINRNNNFIPALSQWSSIWTKNTNFRQNKPDGEVLCNRERIVGFHSTLYKKSVLKNKEYKISISSNWVVDKKYRKYSLLLLNRFFQKESDIYLTTTANSEVAKIWESFGASYIQPENTRKVYYKIFNSNKFISAYFKKKKFNYLIFLFTFVFAFFLKILNKPRFVVKNSNTIKIQSMTDQTSYLNTFNHTYEKNLKVPSEKRGGSSLFWNLNIIKNGKNIHLQKILYNRMQIGYLVIVGKKEKKINLNRAYLAEIRIEKKYYKFINSILNEISIYAKKQKYDLLEFRNLNNHVYKKMNKDNFFLREYSHSPYLIRFNKKFSKKFINYYKKKFEISYLDGDCLF
jgi:hypothetical protein